MRDKRKEGMPSTPTVVPSAPAASVVHLKKIEINQEGRYDKLNKMFFSGNLQLVKWIRYEETWAGTPGSGTNQTTLLPPPNPQNQCTHKSMLLLLP